MITLCLIAGLFIVSNKILIDIFFNYIIEPTSRQSTIEKLKKSFS